MAQKDKEMNLTQLQVALQYIATAVASYVAGKGWLPANVANEAAIWFVAGIPIVLAIWNSRDKGKVAAAAQVDGVKIVAPSAIASSLPATNVVSNETHSVENKDVSK